MAVEVAKPVRSILILVVTVSVAAVLGAATAQAADESTPPTAVVPQASDVRPSVDPTAIAPPYAPAFVECSDWYLQTDYGATWPTGSTWWEYRCSPIGIFDQSIAFWIDYYHWTGSGPGFYGRWVFGWYCWCWWDVSAGQWYSPYASEW